MNASYIKYLNSTQSVFHLSEDHFVKFRTMVEESNQMSNVTKRRAFENMNFYYLLRDLWFLFDHSLQVTIRETSYQEQDVVRAILIRHLQQHFKVKHMTSPLPHNDFANFLFAYMLAEGLMSWLDVRYKSNTKLFASVQFLTKLENKHRITEMMTEDELVQLKLIVIGEIHNVLEKEIDVHYADLYKSVLEVTKSCQQIMQSLHTIVGRKTFEEMQFLVQFQVLENLYNN